MDTPPPQKRTRSSTELYLIGHPCSSIPDSKLPTNLNVLQLLAHTTAMIGNGESLRQKQKRVLDVVRSFWLMAGIPTVSEKTGIDKVDKIYREWQARCKRKTSTSESEEQHKKAFKEMLSKLFDIAAIDAEDQIRKDRMLSEKKKQEDVKFLNDQRGERIGRMDGMDKVFEKKIMAKKSREDAAERRQAQSVATETEVHEDDMSIISGPESEDATGYDSEGSNYVPPVEEQTTSSTIQLSAPKNIMDNAEICGALDRLRLSDNCGTVMASAFIKGCGGNVEDFVLSRSTTRRTRIAQRRDISIRVLDEFRANPPSYAAIHWDGRLTKDRVGEEYEALAVVVSGEPEFREGKLLGVQHLQSSTGREQAEATLTMIELWELEECIVALVFDTTASNTGVLRGAAIRLEQGLNKKLFYFGCRHHILELIMGAICDQLLEEPTGPECAMSNDLKARWKQIDRTKPTE